ncbi:MAG TPA: hypothetical protein PKJ99_12220 [Thermoanaerobaculales bacterium]|nr:hypothetical protein [Thermoanaerobaculales bacterium]HQL30861.1 hypothetical protein [Thermoanaerobaculales bacterium]
MHRQTRIRRGATIGLEFEPCARLARLLVLEPGERVRVWLGIGEAPLPATIVFRAFEARFGTPGGVHAVHA